MRSLSAFLNVSVPKIEIAFIIIFHRYLEMFSQLILDCVLHDFFKIFYLWFILPLESLLVCQIMPDILL